MQAVEALEGEQAANGNAQPVHWFAAMAHRRVRRVALGLAFALLLLLALWWLRFRPFVATDDARVAAPVIVVAPEGNGGRVERVLVKEGQQVEAGQALVELDAAGSGCASSGPRRCSRWRTPRSKRRRHNWPWTVG